MKDGQNYKRGSKTPGQPGQVGKQPKRHKPRLASEAVSLQLKPLRYGSQLPLPGLDNLIVLSAEEGEEPVS